MLASEAWRICLLGEWGFSGKCIADTVARYDGTTYSVSTIYYTLKKAGIRLRDYRDGTSKLAEQRLYQLNRARRAGW